jgi:hypothetical protein
MDIPSLSDQSLRDLHTRIAETLAEDDTLPPGEKKWGVRENPDWRAQSDAFEAEMKKRGFHFTPTTWD